MAGEWREATLDQLGRIVTGKTPPSSGEGYFGGDIPFVTPTDFDGRRVIDSTGRYLTEEGALVVGGSRLPSRAVMVSCIGSDMGKAAIAGHECVTNQQINSIVVESGDDPLFVYYNLSTRKAELRASAGGSAQPILNKSGFGRFDINLPPLPEQRAIAHILGTLDDKIELNRRMNETLEAMARALFKSWFVDFDPVRAKAEGRDPGLPQPLADLFPDSFEDSELGEIPRGWGTSTIRDAFDIVDGRTLPPERRSPHHPFDAFGANGVIGRTDEVSVDSPCIVLGKIGSCGSLHRSPGPCWVTNNAFAVRGGKSGSLEFAWWTFLGIDFTQFVGGSANPYMPLKNFGHYVVVRPSLDVLAAFEARASQLRRRLEHGNWESTTLATLRAVLLPKLISGELRIADAERYVGTVA